MRPIVADVDATVRGRIVVVGRGDSVKDDLHPLDISSPRRRDELAIGDHRRVHAAQRCSRDAPHHTRSDQAVRMEHHRRAQARQRRGGQQSRTVDVHHVGVRAPSRGAAGRVAASRSRSAPDRRPISAPTRTGRSRSAPPESRRHARDRTVRRAPGSPTSASQPRSRMAGEQVEQGLLRAAGVAELVEQEQLHTRTASASTKKYTGSTRQYVSRSPDAICTIWPAQKQSIQMPQKARRGSVLWRAAGGAKDGDIQPDQRRQPGDAGLDQQAEVHVVGDDRARRGGRCRAASCSRCRSMVCQGCSAIQPSSVRQLATRPESTPSVAENKYSAVAERRSQYICAKAGKTCQVTTRRGGRQRPPGAPNRRRRRLRQHQHRQRDRDVDQRGARIGEHQGGEEDRAAQRRARCARPAIRSRGRRTPPRSSPGRTRRSCPSVLAS